MSIAEPRGFGSARGDLADRILEAARRLVVRTGARKLSLSDVATLAGVSRPTIYRYFVSKEDLIDALGTHERRRFDAAMEQAMSGVTGVSKHPLNELDGRHLDWHRHPLRCGIHHTAYALLEALAAAHGRGFSAQIVDQCLRGFFGI